MLSHKKNCRNINYKWTKNHLCMLQWKIAMQRPSQRAQGAQDHLTRKQHSGMLYENCSDLKT